MSDMGFPDKWAKVIKELPEFRDTADAANTEDLKKIIVQSEGNIVILEQEQEKDENLAKAKDTVKTIAGAYRDAKKVQTAKIKYALFLLDGRGVEIGDSEELEKE